MYVFVEEYEKLSLNYPIYPLLSGVLTGVLVYTLCRLKIEKLLQS